MVTTDLGTTVFTQKIFQRSAKYVALGANHHACTYLAFACYEKDGSLDPDFGLGGVAFSLIGSGSISINGGAMQSDGKIIVVGHDWGTAPPNAYFTLARYNIVVNGVAMPWLMLLLGD
ncbi:MAG: delta-60 repeat domain-containing protein [Thermodesulfobacteriota bacterium]|nr:delta-60 repeat domain-containing protein [Thermodesulfobacteriota bacterium]